MEQLGSKEKVNSPKSVSDQNIVLSEKFQEEINIELMNLNVSYLPQIDPYTLGLLDI